MMLSSPLLYVSCFSNSLLNSCTKISLQVAGVFLAIKYVNAKQINYKLINQ